MQAKDGEVEEVGVEMDGDGRAMVNVIAGTNQTTLVIIEGTVAGKVKFVSVENVAPLATQRTNVHARSPETHANQ